MMMVTLTDPCLTTKHVCAKCACTNLPFYDTHAYDVHVSGTGGAYVEGRSAQKPINLQVLGYRERLFPFGRRKACEIYGRCDDCDLSAKFRFLSGNHYFGLKVTLDWVLMPYNAYKILESGACKKPDPISQGQPGYQSWKNLEKEIRQAYVPPLNTRPPYGDTFVYEKWLAICKNLAENLGYSTFKFWFMEVKLTHLSRKAAIIEARTPCIMDYISNHLGFEIRTALQAVHPTIREIHYKHAPHPSLCDKAVPGCMGITSCKGAHSKQENDRD